ncbi:hypothetical protein FZW96_06845 [Bacillus sp. BGMRC 2118]|nr:hypothetical protein FZW96_06845 [Bacillus sp. BGMRC 2118]
MKVLKQSLLIIIVLFVSACTNNKSALDIQEEEPDVDVVEKEGKGKEKVSPDVQKYMRNVSTWDRTIQQMNYNMNIPSCPQGTIAPSYVDDHRIIFLFYGDQKHEIIEFSRERNECRVLYHSNGISDVTGINGKLFWPEYNTKQTTDIEWEIKQLELSTGNVHTISTGRSTKDTPAPTIRLGTDSINWIEYEFTGTRLESRLMSYNASSNEKTTITSSILDESDARDGEYFILQKGVDDDFLLYKSIFQNGEKKLNMSLYNTQGQPVTSFIDEDRILDFISNENYFVYTGEGHLTVVEQNEQKTKHVYQTGDRLTTDSPIFVNEHTLLFRYAMNDIRLSNLKNDKVYSLLEEKGGMVSKPIFTNGYLAYAVITEKHNEKKTEFFVGKIGDK